ncbi:MAG: YeeE/YedE family protein [Alphaproteobacteria bacterium]|nr:YeeE/YedE family protein [Alphaproteobacteria bacterium]
MQHFTPLSSLLGGALIGLAASLLLLLNGRVAGVSGILAGLLPPSRGDAAWRGFFLAGLIIGALLYRVALGFDDSIAFDVPWPWLVVAGLLTGLGTRIGGGCTSGHGVCGISRLSLRSLAATAIFVGVGMVTVFVLRHVTGL